MRFIKSSFNSLATLCLCICLAACATSFTVNGDIPTPLVNKLPLTAKLVYSREFKQYVYTSTDKKRALQSVDLGSSQVDLFNTIFTSLVDLSTGQLGSFDIVIKPEILDFQYSVPRETKLNVFEIWLKYRVKIVDERGDDLADWVIKGYGKTPTTTFASTAKALNAAINIALRDVGAQLAIGFSSQPSIEQLLQQRSARQPR